VSHRTAPHEFGLMMGVQQALRGVASVAGPIGAGLAYQHLGPTVPFFACAVIIACALLLAARVPRTEPVAAAAA
jgi:predicted MFS family arabinose efflux permease